MCPSVPGCGSGYRILIRGLTEKNYKLKSFSSKKFGDMLGAHVLSGVRPDGWTHYMFSLRGGGDGGSIRKIIERVSSYSYI